MPSRRRFLSSLAALGAWVLPRRARAAGGALPSRPPGSARFYVSAEGSDEAGGTSPLTPWATTQRVADLLEEGFFRPGDEVLFRGGDTFGDRLPVEGLAFRPDAPLTLGSYGEGRATLARTGEGGGVRILGVRHVVVQDLDFAGPGEAFEYFASPIVLSGRGGGEVDGVTIRRCSIGAFPRAWGISLSTEGAVGVRGCLFEDVEIEGCLGGVLGWHGVPGERPFRECTFRRVRVGHCRGAPGRTYGGATGSGLLLNGFEDALVEHCRVHHCGELNDIGSGPCAYLIQTCKRVVVRHSIAHHTRSARNDACGFDFDNANEDCTVEYCLAYSNHGSGFCFINPSNHGPILRNRIRYNVSVDDATRRFSAIDVIKDSSRSVFEDNEVYGNTVIKTVSGGRGALGIGSRHGTTRTRIHNNLVVTAGQPLFHLLGSPDRHADLRVQGNLFHALDGRHRYRADGETYGSLAELRAATPVEHVGGEETGLEADPLLLSTERVALTDPHRLADLAAYYRVAPGSPALDGGIDLRAVTDLPERDFFGAAIPPSGPFRAVGAGTTPSGPLPSE